MLILINFPRVGISRHALDPMELNLNDLRRFRCCLDEIANLVRLKGPVL